MLANNTNDGKIIYGVLAGISACLYTAFVLSKRKTNFWGFGKSNKTGLTEPEMAEPSPVGTE